MHIHACVCKCVFVDFCECPNTWGLPNYGKAAVRFTKRIIVASSAWEYAHSLCTRVCVCVCVCENICEYQNTCGQIHSSTTERQPSYYMEHSRRSLLDSSLRVYYTQGVCFGCIFSVCVCRHQISRQLNPSLLADWLVCISLFKYLRFAFTTRHFRSSKINLQWACVVVQNVSAFTSLLLRDSVWTSSCYCESKLTSIMSVVSLSPPSQV